MKAAGENFGEGKVSTKDRILAAAREVFAEKGFDGSSTREIAARAEVNISSLHYHWDSKETLFAAILASVQAELIERLKGVVGVDPPANAADARRTIETAMGVTFDFFADDLSVPRLLMRRILDGGGSFEAGEGPSIDPAWPTFLDWTRVFTGGALDQDDATFFLVTIQSVLLVLMLDSPLLASAVGSIEDPATRARLRVRVIRLIEKLLDVEDEEPGS